MRIKQILVFVFCALFLPFVLPARAEVVEYDLTIARDSLEIAGQEGGGMTINGRIPGPTLRFTEGDVARIRVHNTMDVSTSIHWHGLLVPPDMDGVPYISFPPIAAKSTFVYEFPIRQSGTYWYHSHSELQEQRGLYGSIVIQPKSGPAKADKDHVLLLSDWTGEDPHEVQRTLKRGSEWYALQKGSAQSILGAAKVSKTGEYFKRELQRMPAMDIADVAYDAFLANGRPETALDAGPGDLVRLRIIDGSATTYFHVRFSGGPMTIVAADGIDVEPVRVERLLIGVAETYDVLVRIPDSGSYEFRATAHDGSGFASAWLGSGPRHPAPAMQQPNLYMGMGHFNIKNVFALTPAGTMGMADDKVDKGDFDQPGMMMDMDMHSMEGMESMQQAGDGAMDMSMGMEPGDDKKSMGRADSMAMGSRFGKEHGRDFSFLGADISSRGPLVRDGDPQKRPWPPYDRLKSTKSTAFPKDKPVREVRLTLDGDMERYVWMLNNKPLSESDFIRIKEGEVVRFIMINRTMMHHPMHLHGHFFRVVNGQGDFSPLKHTVNVAPMSTTVIEFYSNEKGDWFFHCHLLYHMKSGMARMVHYDTFDPGKEVMDVRPNLYKDAWYAWVQADVLHNMSQGMVTVSNTRNIISAEWEYAWQVDDPVEWETTATWARYVNRFFNYFAGVNWEASTEEGEDPRGVAGVHYLLPLNFESGAWVDTDGDVRLMLEKEFELTPRWSLFGEVEYDTDELWEGKTGLAYRIGKNLSFLGQWHSEYGFGAGVRFLF